MKLRYLTKILEKVCVLRQFSLKMNSPSDDYDKQIGLRPFTMLLGTVVILPGVVLG